MTKRKRVAVFKEEGSVTDSDNEQLSNSGDTGDYEDDDALSSSGESSTAASSPERARNWNVPEGRKVITMKAPRENVAVGASRLLPESRREGKEVVSKGGLRGRGHGAFRAEGLVIPTRSCLGKAGEWLDSSQKFVNIPPDTRREDYFRTHGLKCYYKPGDAIFLDKTLRDRLKGLEYLHKKCLFNPEFYGTVRHSFQIPEEYEISLPNEGEFIYTRRDDLWVGIPLEHFRAGLRLPMHRFFHALMVNLRLGLGQMGPNSIRKICALISRCTELGLEPTLTLFWSLHSLQASRDYHPLFELHWKGAKNLGGILVEVPSSNKGWHGEWLLFRGGDLGYLPEYRRPDGGKWGCPEVEKIGARRNGRRDSFRWGEGQGLVDRGGFLEVLLRDIPAPSRMDKSRILALARRKQVIKETGSKQSGEDSTAVAESSVNPVTSIGGGHAAVPKGATDSENVPLQSLIHKKRTIKPRVTGRSKKQRAERTSEFRLRVEFDEDGSDVEVIPGFMVAARGTRSDLSDVGGSCSGLPPAPLTPSAEGVEGYTLVRFQARQGWLREDPRVEPPLEALSAFTLAQDRARIERENDEDLIRMVKEAYGKLGTYLMGATERTLSNRRLATAEQRRSINETKARDEALALLKDSQAKERATTLELEKEKEAREQLEGSVSKLEEELQTERGVSASLWTILGQRDKELLQQAEELIKTARVLERVEREANITFEDCVTQYKGSEAYAIELEMRAGEFHEEGYNDCLKFVGAGNVVDPTAHSIDNFQDIEIARLEAEKDKGEEAGTGGRATAETEGRMEEEEAGEPGKSNGMPKDGLNSKGDPDLAKE